LERRVGGWALSGVGGGGWVHAFAGMCARANYAQALVTTSTSLISRAAVMISSAFSHSLFLSSFEAALDSFSI